MQNSTNPFLEFAQMMSPPKTAPIIEQARIASVQPFSILARGLPFSGAELRVNADLLRVPEEGEEPPVRAGDNVLICTANGWQTIFVICKVVTP